MTPPFEYWGVAISQATAEGAYAASDWHRWEGDNRVPRSGEGNGFATRSNEDFELLATIGANAVRYTVDWARLQPHSERWSGEAAEHVLEQLHHARESGLKVWMGLADVALPGWFSDVGSFPDDKARYWWSRYVDRCAGTFGDLVDGWMPIVEPERWARLGYLSGRRPPGHCDERAAAEARRGLTLAQADASRQLRGGPPIATCWNLAIIEPADGTAEAATAVRERERLMWDVEITAMRDGVVDVPGLALEEVPSLAGSADVIGFSYHGSIAIGADGGVTAYPPDGSRAEDGSTWWPDGLAHVLRRLCEALPGRPIMLTGFGVGTTDERRRADLIRSTADVLTDARHDGLPLIGAFHDAGVDGYDWRGGYRLPRGVITDGRDLKLSAAAFTEAGGSLLERSGP